MMKYACRCGWSGENASISDASDAKVDEFGAVWIDRRHVALCPLCFAEVRLAFSNDSSTPDFRLIDRGAHYELQPQTQRAQNASLGNNEIDHDNWMAAVMALNRAGFTVRVEERQHRAAGDAPHVPLLRLPHHASDGGALPTQLPLPAVQRRDHLAVQTDQHQRQEAEAEEVT